MKSLKIILTTALLALFTATAGAQINTDKVAQMQTDKMATELGLNKKQKQQLLALNKKTMKDQQSLMRKGKGKPGKSSRDKARAANKKYEAALKKILTTAQYNKWKAKRKRKLRKRRQ